jgi:hypothetical protein
LKDAPEVTVPPKPVDPCDPKHPLFPKLCKIKLPPTEPRPCEVKHGLTLPDSCEPEPCKKVVAGSNAIAVVDKTKDCSPPPPPPPPGESCEDTDSCDKPVPGKPTFTG